MRAARFYNAGDIRLDNIPEPTLRPGKLLVDVEWCGICGSDLHEFIMGPKVLPIEPHPVTGECLPMALGHELCGRVRDPPPGSRFKDGEAVMVDPRVLCNSCHSCRSHQTHACSSLGYVGGTTTGGFGEVVSVDEARLYPLNSIPLEYAAVIEPLAVVQHAIKQTNITSWSEKTILVLGGGPIGFALLLLLRAHGATRVIVSEPAKLRREQVAEFAQEVIDPTKEKVGERCRAFAGDGEGVDVVFDCAGVPVALQAGMDAIRRSGLYMMVAVWEKPMDIDCWTFLAKHITLKGVLIFSTEDFEEVMQMMAEGKIIGYERMVTSRIDVADIVEKGYKELINNKDQHIKILVAPRKGVVAGGD